MEVRFGRIEKNKWIKMGKRSDLIELPQIGHELVWTDDRDYIVISIAWDLMLSSESAAVIELKLKE